MCIRDRYKGLLAAGYRMERHGGVLITVRDTDKPEIADIAKIYAELGFDLYATQGTAEVLRMAGLKVNTVSKLHEAHADSKQPNIGALLESHTISYIISSDSRGRLPELDSVKIRRKAVELGIPCLTSLDTAKMCIRDRIYTALKIRV